MHQIIKFVSIIVAVFCAIMIYWHWNDHEVSAWIIGFTGWVNHSLEMLEKGKK